jgi:ketosteroid isomerase-like protein
VPGGAEVVRQAYAALGSRDFDRLAELADRDFEMDMTERVLNPATYRGADGLISFLAEVDELWASMDIDAERILERDDDVLALLNVRLEGRGSGLALESRTAHRWTLRDGKLLRLRLRLDPEAALAEFQASD